MGVRDGRRFFAPRLEASPVGRLLQGFPLDGSFVMWKLGSQSAKDAGAG